MILQTVRAPVSHAIEIDDLRPTQMTVGLREVAGRAERLKALAREDSEKVKRKTVIPVVKGPKERLYVIDHHHLCRALLLAGKDKVLVKVVLNLQRLDIDAFWVFLD
ncbi:MAG: ParB-like protein, partial [Methylocystis sp.]